MKSRTIDFLNPPCGQDVGGNATSAIAAADDLMANGAKNLHAVSLFYLSVFIFFLVCGFNFVIISQYLCSKHTPSSVTS